ncbi:MAG: phosphotransferase [Turicibacter sp.]
MELTKVVGTGAQATVYLCGDDAIKVFNEACSKTAIFYEALINSMIEQTHIRIPKTYEVVTVDHRLAIKMDYVRGVSLIDCLLKDPENSLTYVEKMVDLHIEIHKEVVELPFSFKQRLQNKIKLTDRLDTAQKETVLNTLDQLPEGKTLCHGDFHGYNILVCNKEYWTIDWIDASYGCSNGDVCRTYMIYSIYAKEVADLYLTLYCNKSGKTRDEILAWLPVIAAARLSEKVEGELEQLMCWITSSCR